MEFSKEDFEAISAANQGVGTRRTSPGAPDGPQIGEWLQTFAIQTRMSQPIRLGVTSRITKRKIRRRLRHTRE
jgi:hypothetical protein